MKELLEDHFALTVIAGLIILFIGVPVILWFGKSKDAYKKFHEEDEEVRRWRETLNDGERPMYRK